MQSIEISARTVSEAVELALAQLGRDRDEVAIAVLDTGETSEEALVRVTVVDDDGDDDGDGDNDGDSARDAVSSAPPPAEATPPAPEPAAQPAAEDNDDDGPPAAPVLPDSDDPAVIARSLLEELLKRMDIYGYVTAERTQAPGQQGGVEETITLHVEGADEQAMGLLIGRRGETLYSVQFLLNLLVSRKLQRWPQMIVDVGNYRQRRRESLEGLARRIAERVRQSRRSMTLEPMAAYERRIVHLALREDASVYTQSTGEGSERKVVIHPANAD